MLKGGFSVVKETEVQTIITQPGVSQLFSVVFLSSPGNWTASLQGLGHFLAWSMKTMSLSFPSDSYNDT